MNRGDPTIDSIVGSSENEIVAEVSQVKELKAKFIELMSKTIPDGVEDEDTLKSMIRVFSGGWLQALVSVGMQATADKTYESFKQIYTENWRPDYSWKWWN